VLRGAFTARKQSDIFVALNPARYREVGRGGEAGATGRRENHTKPCGLRVVGAGGRYGVADDVDGAAFADFGFAGDQQGAVIHVRRGGVASQEDRGGVAVAAAVDVDALAGGFVDAPALAPYSSNPARDRPAGPPQAPPRSLAIVPLSPKLLPTCCRFWAFSFLPWRGLRDARSAICSRAARTNLSLIPDKRYYGEAPVGLWRY
jgi:hypothetical protein